MILAQSLLKRCATAIQGPLERWIQLRLTALAYQLSHCQWPWLKNRLIVFFLSHWTPDLQSAEKSDPFAYASFNAFFTRALQATARPIPQTSGNVLAPADGTLTQCHLIEDGQLIQAKGLTYTLKALLANEPALIQRFNTGLTSTTYLAPTDYHRVHMPLTGTLSSMTHVPGTLFSVNTDKAEICPNLFARNERLICIFETAHGPLAVIMVGALLVASIETVWGGLIRPAGFGKIITTHYPQQQAPTLKQGALMGWFHFGSTVITLLNAATTPNATLTQPGPHNIQYGIPIAQLKRSPHDSK